MHHIPVIIFGMERYKSNRITRRYNCGWEHVKVVTNPLDIGLFTTIITTGGVEIKVLLSFDTGQQPSG